MADFSELTRQMQQAQQQVADALWWHWVLLFLVWAVPTGVLIYVCVHLVGLIKAAIRFIEAKTEQAKGAAAGGAPFFGSSPELRRDKLGDSDVKYRPRM